MDDSNEAKTRKDNLVQIFEQDIKFEMNRARWDHWISLTLLFIAITASGLAGILGLAGLMDVKWIGAIALIPNLMLLFGRSFKFAEKSAWHYRKRNRLLDLKEQLLFQLPANPSLDQVAAINKRRHRLTSEMQLEWEQELAPDWAGTEQGRQLAQNQGHNQQIRPM
jgi:hypothetical protein